MPAIHKTLPSTDFKITRGQALLKLDGDSAYRNIGSVTAEIEIQREATDIRTNEAPERPIVATVTTDLQANINLTCWNYSKLVMAVSHSAPAGVVVIQPAVTDATQNLVAVKVGDIFDLMSDGKRVLDVTDVVVTAGGTVAVLGRDYIIDAAAGRFESVTLTGGITVEFSAPAITLTDDKALYEFISRADIRGSLVIRQNNRRGANLEYVFPRVVLAPAGNIGAITDSNDASSQQFACRVEYDSTQLPGRERGYVTVLDQAL